MKFHHWWGLCLAVCGSTVAVAAEPVFDFSLGLYAAGSSRELDSDYQPTADSFESINSASHADATVTLRLGGTSIAALYERGIRNDRAGIMPVRQRNLVVDSPAGRLLLGDAPSEYRVSGERLDPFYDTALAGFNGRVLGEGANYGLSNLSNSVTRNSIAYSTPLLFDGLQLSAAGYIGTQDAPNNKVDRALGLSWAFKGLGGEGNTLLVGAQALKIENATAFVVGNSRLNRRSPVGGSPGESDNLRLHAAFTTPSFSLGVSAEHIDVKAERKARGYLFTSASYAVSPKLRLAASYGRLEFKAGSPALSGDSYAIGGFARLFENVTGYLALRQTMLDTPGDATIVAVGLSYVMRTRLFAVGGDEAAAQSEPIE